MCTMSAWASSAQQQETNFTERMFYFSETAHGEMITCKSLKKKKCGCFLKQKPKKQEKKKAKKTPTTKYTHTHTKKSSEKPVITS